MKPSFCSWDLESSAVQYTTLQKVERGNNNEICLTYKICKRNSIEIKQICDRNIVQSSSGRVGERGNNEICLTDEFNVR